MTSIMNPAINLMHLKFFCDAVVHESISEAAKMNYISQSAVSQAIAKLETIFGVQLTFKNCQKMQITAEGKVVFEQAQAIFGAVQNTFDMINQTKNITTGNVRFVTTKSLGTAYVAPKYKSIKQSLPGINFKFRMEGISGIHNALKKENIEFAIVVNNQNFEEFEKLPLAKGYFHLYYSKEVSPEIINDGIFVYEFDCLYVQELKKHMENLGCENPIQDAIAGWELTARFAELGIGVGFFPDYLVSHNSYPNVIIHPFEIPPFEYEICAIYNKGFQFSRSTRLFLEHLQKV